MDQFNQNPADSPPTSPQSRMYSAGDMQHQTDLQHVKLLSIFYYVFAGLQLLGGCIGLIYVVLGAAVTTAPHNSRAGGPPPGAAGGFLIGMGGCIGLICVVFAVMMLLAGINLGRQQRRTLCQVAAGLACLSIPLGTVLGVFTFVVLSRPSVIAMFEANRHGRM